MRNNSLYKFVITSIILILALSVSGYGRCIEKNSFFYNNGAHTCTGSAPNLICTLNERQIINYTSCTNSSLTVPKNSCGNYDRTFIVNYGCDGGSDNLSFLKYDYCISSGDYVYYKSVVCSTRQEADSARCALNPSDPSCCDAHCECDKAGGTWHPNGYCVKDCQTEACCDSLNVPQVAYDSVYIWQNNSCALHWRCEPYQAECVAINGLLVADVLPDTTTQDGTTTITNKCYYNCGRVIPSDSSKSMVDGNIVLPSSAALISQGIKTPNPFDAIRSEDNGEYTYDFLSPQAGHYLDSIAFTPCVQVLYRCVLNGKYAYYYDNQTAPSGCTNIVKIK